MDRPTNAASPQTLWAQFDDNGGSAALVTSHACFTYQELAFKASALAQALVRSRVRTNQHVGIWCGSTPEFFIALLAVWRAGATAVPLDPKEQGGRLRAIVEKGKLDHVIAKTGLGVPETLQHVHRVTFAHGELEVSAADELPDIPTSKDLAAILFTSGSTGVSKGVMLSYGSILGNANSMASVLRLKAGDRLLFNIAFHLTSAIGHFLTCLTKGATCIALQQMAFGKELTDHLLRYRATAFGGAPIQLARIIDHIAGQDETAGGQPSRLRLVMGSGDALPVTTIEKWRKHRPDAQLYTVYGLTELGARFCVLTPEHLPNKAGSVGKPIDGLAMSLRDEDGRAIIQPNVVGQVHAEGDFLMTGYFDDPASSKTALTEHGLATGDLGYLDEDGFLYLVGRSDDVFKSSGVKVSTKVVEDRLWELNLFSDIAVWPVAHPQFGLVPYAFFVLREDAAFNRSTVTQSLKDRMSSAELPKNFVAVDRIPRLANGKLNRAAMDDIVQEMFGQAG